MPSGALDKILNNSPATYRALYQARDNLGIVLGPGGLKKYLHKRRYLKKYKDSWVYFSVPTDDPQFHISVGKFSYCPDQITVGYIPAKGKRYEISVGSFTKISGNLNIIISKAHTLDSVSNSLNNLFLDRRGIKLYQRYHKESYGSVHIGSDVWIGADVVIIGNVKIGDGAVIGARSVVTHDVPPFSVTAGVPAKHIRYRFSKPIVKALMRIKWWNWDEKEITERMGDFYKPEKFIKKYG